MSIDQTKEKPPKFEEYKDYSPDEIEGLRCRICGKKLNWNAEWSEYGDWYVVCCDVRYIMTIKTYRSSVQYLRYDDEDEEDECA